MLRIRRAISAKGRSVSTPCYVYDSHAVIKNVKRVQAAFAQCGIPTAFYYALKSNPYSGLLKTLKQAGIKFDVSSMHEFGIAQKIGTNGCVYTGPGKTEADLRFFISKAPKNSIIHLESFQELLNFKKAAVGLKKRIRCGVRVVPSTHAKWDKFGIPLSALKSFIEQAMNCPQIELCAIQFHISYVKTSKPYCDALREVGTYLRKVIPQYAAQFTCIDIGGGLYPESYEGEYPWNKEGVLLFEKPGLIQKILKLPPSKRAKKISVQPIETIARDIGHAFKRWILPVSPNADLAIEPGRFLSFCSMHLLMQVVDRKTPNSVIVNAGWNMVGWEKFQYLYYSPIYNLTRWNPNREFSRLVYGNLCIPDDIWGYYVHGKGCEVGDLLLLPFQGAYTYTYRQEFIRGIPPVMDI